MCQTDAVNHNGSVSITARTQTRHDRIEPRSAVEIQSSTRTTSVSTVYRKDCISDENSVFV